MNTLAAQTSDSLDTFHPDCLANVNMLWGGVVAHTLYKLGLKQAVIAPGSRSAPLVVGFGCHEGVEALPILDERSAAFFALGLAKKSRNPVALICSSGTAAANFYPAVIEAKISHIPLIILTADRPQEKRQCLARQTIDQVKMYGNNVSYFNELPLPEKNTQLFHYLRQTVMNAWDCARSPYMGPVHINVPFREPLAPSADESMGSFINDLNLDSFFDCVIPTPPSSLQLDAGFIKSQFETLKKYDRGLIVVGPVQNEDPDAFCQAVSRIADTLGWPVLAESISPIRHNGSQFPNLVTRYDLIFKNPDLINELAPEAILQLGPTPICKSMRLWMKSHSLPTWIVDPSMDNVTAVPRAATPLRTTFSSVAACLPDIKTPATPYCEAWLKLEKQAESEIEKGLSDCQEFFEGKAAWVLAENIADNSAVWVSSSMPIRDVEFFWPKNDRKSRLFCSLGANGIDGTLSCALGMGHEEVHSYLLTGDLTLLHDTNGFLNNPFCRGPLTVILVNNNGGGIFQNLPISQCESVFEKYFITPQCADFEKLAAAYGVEYYCPNSWDAYASLLTKPHSEGIRLIELKTDRNFDVPFRKELFQKISNNLKL